MQANQGEQNKLIIYLAHDIKGQNTCAISRIEKWAHQVHRDREQRFAGLEARELASVFNGAGFCSG